MTDPSRTNQELLKENSFLKQKIQELEKSESKRKPMEEELNCLYGISALFELPGISLDEILKRTVMLIPPAWQFPEITEASIVLEGKIFQTARFRETSWMQTREVIVNGMPAGQVKVCYLEERQASDEGPFFKEERKLLNVIAERLGRITERKRAEYELSESEKHYHMLFNAIDEGFCIIEVIFDENEKPIDYRFLSINPSFEKQTGLIGAQGKRMRELAPKHEEHWFEIYGKIAVTGQPARFVKRAEQLHRWYDVYAFRVGQPENRQVAILFNDITERYQVENELRESKELLRTVLNNAPITIFATDDRGVFTLSEGKSLEIVNLKPGENVGESAMDLFGTLPVIQFNGDTLNGREVIRRVLAGEILTGITKLRDVYFDNQFVPYYDVHDRVIGMIGVATIITERLRVEEALRESEERFRKLFESLPQLVWTCQPDGPCDFLSPQWVKYTGIPEVAQLGFGWLKQLHPDDREPTTTAWNSACASGSDFHVKSRIRRHDGVYHWFYTHAVLLHGLDGRPDKWFGSNTDINDLNQAEEALRESELRYHLLFEKARDGIALVNAETGAIVDCNQALCRMMEKDKTELLGQPQRILHPQLNLINGYSSSFHFYKTGDSEQALEDNLLSKSGKIIPVEIRASRIRMRGCDYLLSLFRNITERKQAEEILKASLREKDVLLNEIHHRVKNNMQVISGLFDLQARASQNPELIERLNESQSRIRSMALVHEKLYASKDFARIELVGYVKALTQELFQSYSINPGKIDLTIQTDGEVYVDITKAIPCGLIMNELISNALKHAFPGDRPGKLHIIISETKNTEIEIIVRDNGMGLPDNVDIHQPRSVGLHLVNGLVKNQLDGQIEVRRDNGTEFRIKFPL